MGKLPARTWLDTWKPGILGYCKSGYPEYEQRFEVAKTLYPYVDIRQGLRGLEPSRWQDQLVERIIDLEEEWGFTRADWFIKNNHLFLTSDVIAAMFKMMQT